MARVHIQYYSLCRVGLGVMWVQVAVSAAPFSFKNQAPEHASRQKHLEGEMEPALRLAMFGRRLDLPDLYWYEV